MNRIVTTFHLSLVRNKSFSGGFPNSISGEDPFPVSHPPHISMDAWNSAFIPFCAFKTDLNISKNPLALPGTTFPLCNSFLPTILEGQLCYKLTLNMTSGQGKRNALTLLLDYNEDRSLQKSPTVDKANTSSGSTLNFDTAVESIQGAYAKVHINTLSPYIGFGGGYYKMTDVKKMTAKNIFLKMPLEDRQCEIESYEGCRTRQLLKECKCGPWERPGHQVKTTNTDKICNKKLFFAGPRKM